MSPATTPWAWLTASRTDVPERRFRKASWSRQKPVKKAPPLQQILPNIYGLRYDEDVEEFLFKTRKGVAVVNYGSSWCTHCHEMFPHMIALSERFSNNIAYAVGQVDYLSEKFTASVNYTPTFAVYKGGKKKVDAFYGSDKQQLCDHLWLWHDDA
jgi:thioredoxin 1